MKLSDKQQGHLVMLFVMLLFGLNIPINKYLYNTGLVSPFVVITLRMTFATLMFWCISLFLPKEKVEKKDKLILLLGGVSGMLLNQGLFAFGLSKSSPVDASIITTSSPLFALIIAAVILKEPITLRKAGGVFTGIAGAVFLIYSSLHMHHGAESHESSLVGDMAVLGAQFFYSFYLVITRPLSNKYSSFTMMKWMFLVASLISLPMFFNDIKNAPLFYQTDSRPFLALAFVLVGATFFTYMLIPFVQRRIRATTISMYNNVQPLIASSIAIFLGQDRFTLEKLGAAILIFVGVYLVTTSKSRDDVEQENFKEKIKSDSE